MASAHQICDLIAQTTTGTAQPRVPREVRDEVCRYAGRRRREGAAWAVIARETGLEVRKLQRWNARAPPAASVPVLRPVARRRRSNPVADTARRACPLPRSGPATAGNRPPPDRLFAKRPRKTAKRSEKVPAAGIAERALEPRQPIRNSGADLAQIPVATLSYIPAPRGAGYGLSLEKLLDTSWNHEHHLVALPPLLEGRRSDRPLRVLCEVGSPNPVRRQQDIPIPQRGSHTRNLGWQATHRATGDHPRFENALLLDEHQHRQQEDGGPNPRIGDPQPARQRRSAETKGERRSDHVEAAASFRPAPQIKMGEEECSGREDGSSMEAVRIDKYLWAVRLCRTRSAAASACRRGTVKIGGTAVRASRLIRAGERIAYRRDGVWMEYGVREVLEKRVGAKLVETYLEDLSSDEAKAEAAARRERGRSYRGKGKPSRKEREAMKKLFSDGE